MEISWWLISVTHNGHANEEMIREKILIQSPNIGCALNSITEFIGETNIIHSIEEASIRVIK